MKLPQLDKHTYCTTCYCNIIWIPYYILYDLYVYIYYNISILWCVYTYTLYIYSDHWRYKKASVSWQQLLEKKSEASMGVRCTWSNNDVHTACIWNKISLVGYLQKQILPIFLAAGPPVTLQYDIIHNPACHQHCFHENSRSLDYDECDMVHLYTWTWSWYVWCTLLFATCFWPRHVTGDHTSTQGRDFVAKRNDDHSSDVMEISFSSGATTLEILETTAWQSYL